MNAEKKPDALIAELAGRQHGVVARRQLLAEGVSPKVVDRHIASGRLRPVHRGVYLLGSLRGPLEPLRAREMAAVLACGRGAVLSHRSAGWLWGLIRRPGSSEPPEVTIPGAARRQRPGIRIRRGDLSSDEIRRLEGLPVTAPGRTIRDLAAVLDPRALGRAAARGEREGLLDAAGFPELVARHGRRPGAPALRAALLGDGGPVLTRSEAERRFLALVREAELPRPRTNLKVSGYEVDFFWSRERLAVEVDGYAFHSSRGSFEADRRRDADLASKGIRVLRFTWRQIVTDQAATAARLGGALTAASLGGALSTARLGGALSAGRLGGAVIAATTRPG